MEEKRISLKVDKEDEYLYLSLSFTDFEGRSEQYSDSVRNGENKDKAFTHLLYELMRLDSLYGIPNTAQLDVLYGLIAEENVDIIEKNQKNL